MTDLHISIDQNNDNLLSSFSSQGEPLSFSLKLNKGNYNMVLEFINVINSGDEDSNNENDCNLPNLYLSFAVNRYTGLKKMMPLSLDGYTDNFPNLDGMNDAFKSYSGYTQTFSKNTLKINEISNESSVLKTYELENPNISEDLKDFGFTGIWKITFSLHYDFLTSGGLGIMLANSKKALKNQFQSLSCIAKGSCLIGKRSEKNAVSLYTVFGPGKFYLAIYFNDMSVSEREMLNDIGGLIPYSIHVNLEPVIEKEDRFNCDAAHIPHSLNIPGLLDNRGFLRYSDRVIVDFLHPLQTTSFELEKPSVVRIVTVEPDGIDIDITFKDVKNNILDRSEATGESEGILREVLAGTYTLEYKISNSLISNPRHKFCETFILEIGISPTDSVKELVRNLGLNSCQDSTQDLQKTFLKIEKELTSTSVLFEMNPEPNKFYKLPLSSVAVGEEVVFRASFELEVMAYGYFDIFSDFVLNDFTISLEKKISRKKVEIIKGDTRDSLKLGKHDRKSFQGQLSPGTYNFIIKSGPTAKELIEDDYTEKKEDDNYQALPHCGAFQLRIHLATLEEKDFKNWACFEKDAQLIPSTFNTIDKLSIRDTPAGLLPNMQYFANNVLAPNSNDGITHDVNFYLETESVIRVITETTGAKMKLTLKRGSKIEVEEDSTDNKIALIYSINQILDQHQTYTLIISYFSKNTEDCQTYSAFVQITPTTHINQSNSKICNNNLPGPELITERFMDAVGLSLFSFNTDTGISSLTDEKEYQYLQSSKPLKVVIPIMVVSEGAIMTAHIQSNFGLSGLIMQITQDDATIH